MTATLTSLSVMWRGAELEVVLGGINMFRRAKHVYIEIHKKEYGDIITSLLMPHFKERHLHRPWEYNGTPEEKENFYWLRFVK